MTSMQSVLESAARATLRTLPSDELRQILWRFIAERRAISLDPNCGWARGKADVLYVADAFKVIARVNELLRAK